MPPFGERSSSGESTSSSHLLQQPLCIFKAYISPAGARFCLNIPDEGGLTLVQRLVTAFVPEEVLHLQE